MDPFSALSLAGVVVQFVEFGVKLTMKSSEMYSSVSGQSQADLIILQDTNRLGEFTEQLSQSFSSNHSVAEAKIASLARECAAEAQKLRRILYGLQGLTIGEKVKHVLDGLNNSTAENKLAAVRVALQDEPEFDTFLQQLHGSTDEEKLKAILVKFPVPKARKRSTVLVAALKSLWKKKEVEEIHANLKEYRAQLTLCMVGLMNDKQSSVSALLEQLVETSKSGNDDKSTQLVELKETLHQIRNSLSLQQAASTDIESSSHLVSIPARLDLVIKLGDSAINTVLKGLRFDSMRAREAAVSSAYKETFEWLFTDESPFYSWLSESSGIFWVSGKPGSGKSTLMKFVSGHEQCRKALQAWAGDRLLITASFYFWHPGTPMQRSLQGLLQTVLYQIMRSCPLLIPIIAPDRWAGALNRTIEDPWTWEEATATLDRFVNQKQFQCATCLFIDGLDEFGGDHSEIVKILSGIPDHSNIKLCVASRPHNVFVDAFGQSPDRMLRLQDLTREDIRRFVNDNLQFQISNSQMSMYRDQYSVLVEDIVNKAEGVFLWVYLVVRSMKDGLTNADTISKLQQRLQKLPSGLSEYFSYILGSVDEVYWEDTAKVFQMIVLSQHPLPPGVLTVLDEDDPDHCLKVEPRLIPAEGYEHYVKIIERRLNARCKGLLEIRKTPGSLWGSVEYSDRYLVSYLHRTVRDFLRNDDVAALLKGRLSAPFDADLALCRGYLLHLKRFIISEDPYVCKELSFSKAADDLVYFSRRCEMISGSSPIQLLDEALRMMRKGGIVSAIRGLDENWFFTKLLQHGLPRYVEHRLLSSPQFLSVTDKHGQKTPALELALTSASLQADDDRYDCFLSPSQVQVLLKAGADPNEMASGSSKITVWMSFVAYSTMNSEYVRLDRDIYFQTFSILLKAGAERYAGLLHDVQSVFPVYLARQLEQLIKELDAAKKSDAKHAAQAVDHVGTQELSGGEDVPQKSSRTTDTASAGEHHAAHDVKPGTNDEGHSSSKVAHDQTSMSEVKRAKPRSQFACGILSCFRSR
ncbi:hypothetical protein F5Y17DRAFT_5906 [Xylariaceae sp. FL0594]|nr:hypothetical protein F5Y17DRAFT_5906 [Xylariaceae sp. FL0594]